MSSRLSHVSHLTPEEQDQLHRSVKKHKRAAEVPADTVEPSSDPDNSDTHGSAWQSPSFAEILTRPKQWPPLYTGEGEDDLIDELGLTNITQEHDVLAEGELCPVVDIPWDSYRQSWNPWRRALIIRVLGRNIHFRVLADRIQKLWQLEYECELIDIDKGYLVARFYFQANYLRVINGGPWMVLDHYLTISKWKPNFRPGANEIRSTLVWLRLPLLPLEMFVEDTLLRVGNAVGRAIKVDPFTADMFKGRYTRVCVELDLHGPLPPNVLIWGRKQPVEYEGLHHICYQYGRYGHKKDQCSAVTTSPGGAEDRPSSCAPKPATGGTADQPFGPWMLPAHVRRKQQLAQTRLHRRAQPSEANYRLNAEIETQMQAAKQKHPTSDGSKSFVFGSHTAHRGEPSSSGQKGQSSATRPSAQIGVRSQYSVLTDLVEDPAVSDIEVLKQKIRDLSGKAKIGGHEKAHIKLEKGLKSQVGLGPSSISRRSGTSRGQDVSRQPGPVPRGVKAQNDKRIEPGPPSTGPPAQPSLSAQAPNSSPILHPHSNVSSGQGSPLAIPPPARMDVDQSIGTVISNKSHQEAVAAVPPISDTEMAVIPSSSS